MNIYTGWAAINLPEEFNRLKSLKYNRFSLSEHPECSEDYFNTMYLMSTILGLKNLKNILKKSSNHSINMIYLDNKTYELSINIQTKGKMMVFESHNFNIPSLSIKDRFSRNTSFLDFLMAVSTSLN